MELTPVVLTHRELKKPSVFRTKTSEAHPNTAPAKHRHSTRPVAKVRQYLALMVPYTHTNTGKKINKSPTLFIPAYSAHSCTQVVSGFAPIRHRKKTFITESVRHD